MSQYRYHITYITIIELSHAIPTHSIIYTTYPPLFTGNAWTKIALQLPGRSENEVKNRFNSTIRKRKGSDISTSAVSTNESDDDHERTAEDKEDSVGAVVKIKTDKVRKNLKSMITAQPKTTTQVQTNRGSNLIPSNCCIISVSKDDVQDLILAEKLFDQLMSQTEYSRSSLYYKLMSTLLEDNVSDNPAFPSTISSLNMVKISNIADSVNTEQPLRVNTNRHFGQRNRIENTIGLELRTPSEYKSDQTTTSNTSLTPIPPSLLEGIKEALSESEFQSASLPCLSDAPEISPAWYSRLDSMEISPMNFEINTKGL